MKWAVSAVEQAYVADSEAGPDSGANELPGTRRIHSLDQPTVLCYAFRAYPNRIGPMCAQPLVHVPQVAQIAS